ncbi:MAG: heat-inducible transcriptional repressor HrcA [Actinomycetota bacterium]|nr:heat-inducible transcriptional repressor HrcA [Actinomycetota bacterium]MDK1016395.1 heat-inducible transcriptional repressor HrcA [Actinomycetota bacterium]MDK1027288.1 heat-inducible transcriptional repressor HrcA [Actinomycetota bacterium]MDK1038111.1 heat-inducible transcriptional repressor HrcA [Actinomycetota bacterium]MDK1096419.1 heat-inducible transcriptional repressor HrcA [Actinomycetota bacterium]
MLDSRRSEILKALIEEYIRTGEPVSSQAVLDLSGLDVSSATVRNDLAQLESYGFVTQPHTSSGRIPTHQGYRFYVDHLSPERLRQTTRNQIDKFFQQVHRQISEVLRDTSTLVSELTAYPAVVVGPAAANEVVTDIRLVPLGGTVVLAVAIAESGRVYQEFVDTEVTVDRDTLETAERLIAAAFQGNPLDKPEPDRLATSDLPAMVRRIIRPVCEQLAGHATGPREVYVGGTSQMASLWSDLSMVQHLLELLDEEAALIDLMSDGTDGLAVRIGPDLGDESDLAVVATTYETPSGSRGRMGVIGPMRMDYRRAIRVVERVSEGLESSFEAHQ